MNENDVERRLESLAAASASPDVPVAILDRMVQLEAGAGSAIDAVGAVPVTRARRVRVGSSPRTRGLTMLGLAAVLALVGGVIYISGSRPVQPNPAPALSASLEPSRRVDTATVAPTVALRPAPTPPASLGPWRQVHSFGGEWTFGHIWGGGPFQPVWLSWQNNEIVGLATRYGAPEVQQTCVMQSKNGTDWTCALLPTPTGEACGPGPCPEVSGLAVRNGRWVVVGYSSFKSPSVSMESSDRMTLLTWTSDDGINWSVEPHAPSPSEFIPGIDVVGAPTPPSLEATGSGFLMAGCQNTDQPGLRISKDGTDWQPVTFAPGSLTMTCAFLGAPSTAGYMADGWCMNGTAASKECVGFSSDGLTWTTSDPLAGAPDGAGRLRMSPADPPAYVDGQWVVGLDNGADGNYEASSPDGIHWTVALAPWPDLLSTEPGLNEGDYHPAVFSQLAPAGIWGLNNGPRAYYNSAMPSPGYSLVPTGSRIYWSATGRQWQSVSDAPPGWPVAVVETPTSLVAFMDVAPVPPSTPITSVWIADKR